MITLRHAAGRSRSPLDLTLGRYSDGPALVCVSLHVTHATATLQASHLDAEGIFHEQVDASTVLDRVGERALDHELAALSFESGTPTTIQLVDDLARHAPELLDR